MELSIFLFRLFGFYFLIVSGFYLFRHEQLKAILEDFYKNRAIAPLMGVITLIMGLIVVLSFNHWELSARGVITLLGYIMVLKGILNLYFPQVGHRLIDHFNERKIILPIGALSFLLGLWLLYLGF